MKKERKIFVSTKFLLVQLLLFFLITWGDVRLLAITLKQKFNKFYIFERLTSWLVYFFHDEALTNIFWRNHITVFLLVHWRLVFTKSMHRHSLQPIIPKCNLLNCFMLVFISECATRLVNNPHLEGHCSGDIKAIILASMLFNSGQFTRLNSATPIWNYERFSQESRFKTYLKLRQNVLHYSNDFYTL